MIEQIGFEWIYEIEFLIDKNDNLYFNEIILETQPGAMHQQ